MKICRRRGMMAAAIAPQQLLSGSPVWTQEHSTIEFGLHFLGHASFGKGEFRKFQISQKFRKPDSSGVNR